MNFFKPRKTLFGKDITATDMARQELDEISIKLLHYQNEELLAQSHVAYLLKRKAQVQEQFDTGYFDVNIPTSPRPEI